VFRRDLIESAYASPTPTTVTDDATLVQLTGATVRIVEGPDTNLKITTANDLNYAEFLIEKGLV
jgi:2-C-methyl-D-erythritol 4-phosphate cytidylyltransferase